MTSLYGLYIKERQGAEIIETNDGFLSYRIEGREAHILELFVLKEQRHTKVGSRMIAELAKQARAKECTFISATVCPQARGATVALLGALHLGFKLHSASPNLIYIVKEL